MERELAVGDHVTTDGMDVRVITAKRLTPTSPSGASFRLLPAVPGDWIDMSYVQRVTGFSDREIGEEARSSRTPKLPK